MMAYPNYTETLDLSTFFVILIVSFEEMKGRKVLCDSDYTTNTGDVISRYYPNYTKFE